MRPWTRGLSLTFAFVLAAVQAAGERPDGRNVAVDPRIPRHTPGTPLSGDLHICGGDSMKALVKGWIEIFKKAHPDVHVFSCLYASGTAAPALEAQKVQVGPVAREMLPYEESLFRNRPYKPYGIPVGGGSYDTKGYTDTLVVYVNKDNPIRRLTLDQLDAIFSSTRKRGYKEDITRWGQLGLTGEWADKPIKVYSNQMPNGHADSFRRLVLDGGEFKDTVIQLGHSPDVVAVEGEAGARVTLKIAEDRYGIGYAGHYLAKPGTTKVALAEKEGKPYFAGTFDEAVSRAYPLSRFIYLYLNKWPNKPLDPLGKEFVRVALSKEGQEVVAQTAFLPLPAEFVEKSRAMLE